MRTFAKIILVGVEKKEYVAPEVWSVMFECERGYATSDCDHTLFPTPPDGNNGNIASRYEHETWVW